MVCSHLLSSSPTLTLPPSHFFQIEQRKFRAQTKKQNKAMLLVEQQQKQEGLILEMRVKRIEREKTMLGNRVKRLKSGKTITADERRKK